jgi:hypothetical protein
MPPGILIWPDLHVAGTRRHDAVHDVPVNISNTADRLSR